jgi:hypothetical protein
MLLHLLGFLLILNTSSIVLLQPTYNSPYILSLVPNLTRLVRHKFMQVSWLWTTCSNWQGISSAVRNWSLSGWHVMILVSSAKVFGMRTAGGKSFMSYICGTVTKRIFYMIHTIIYLLTYSMVQSPSWAADWFAASQEIPRISRNLKFHYRTHKRPPPVSILGQPNPVHIPTSHLLEIHPKIHPSTPRSPHTLLYSLHNTQCVNSYCSKCILNN